MTIIKVCSFSTFAEAKEAQHYDHLHMKATAFAVVTGINVATIKENNLHILNENGYEALDQYILNNNIEVVDCNLYEQTKKYWINTTGWSTHFKYQDKFVYFKDHSDRNYNILEVDNADLIPLDEDGNEVEVENGV
jgi:hypothetical protein